MIFFPKRTMPTRIDVAAENVQEEISNAVEQIENNLLASQSSCPSSHDDAQLPSPLFRDEVQQQEMRYLDHLLLGKNRPTDGTVQQSQSEGAAADGHKKYKESFGTSPKVQPPPNRSKIASILKPYDRNDDDEKKQSHNPNQASMPSQNRDESQHMHNKQPNQNDSKRSSIPNLGNPFSHRLHEKVSKLIHHHQPPKNNNKRNYNQKRARTAAPSRNKRRQMNHKFIQRAQLSSRRVVAKMVRLGRRCTHSLTTVKNVVNQSVARAIANAHSMLEETSVHNGVSHVKRGQDININENNKVGTVDNAGQAKIRAGEGDTATVASSSQNHSSVPVPPKDAFSMTSSWMLGGTERMSSKAVSMVQNYTRNEKVQMTR
mmetsp:Transcript_33071/g.69604  ORF Transcript_33071/g.69604 Transcript_33071/m.69604 type:complete len:374 (+) Transcript_33071:99-1220(+)